MYTADQARQSQANWNERQLDDKISFAVAKAKGNNASIRVAYDDPWCQDIEKELTKRGFINIVVPNIVLSGDVYFEW